MMTSKLSCFIAVLLIAFTAMTGESTLTRLRQPLRPAIRAAFSALPCPALHLRIAAGSFQLELASGSRSAETRGVASPLILRLLVNRWGEAELTAGSYHVLIVVLRRSV